MALFKRIVVGTDGSDSAREAVRQAAALASLTEAELHVVSAYEPVTSRQVQSESAGVPEDVAHETGPREEVNFILDAAAGIATEYGIDTRSHPSDGDPADAILLVAEEVEADLIVVGNKGMTGARRFLLGSVPNKVSHHARCSVFIARTTA